MKSIKSNNQLTDPGKTQRLIEIMLTFGKLGCTAFGGPIAHLAYFQREFVERRHWLSQQQYAQLVAIGQFLPGPASSQVGFAIGLLRAGFIGGLLAFVCFTLPSILLLLGFIAVLPWFSSDLGQALLHALKLVACVVVADAVWMMARKLCATGITRIIALVAMALMLLFTGVAGQLAALSMGAALGGSLARSPTTLPKIAVKSPVSKPVALFLFALFSLLMLIALLPWQSHILFQTAQIFYRTGALVFGGGHVVLPWLEAILVPQWLAADLFLTGYGAAQALPGPLFSFAAYLGALMAGSSLSIANALVATAAVFLPGFLLMMACIPYWQWASQSRSLQKILIGINASVVGLLAATLVDPILVSTIRGWFDAIVIIAVFGLLRLRQCSILWVFSLCLAGALANGAFAILV